MLRAFLVLLVAAPWAAAQPMAPESRPVAGTLMPRAGVADVAVGVRAQTEVPVAGCSGYVAPAAPDVVVDWPGGDLRVWVRASFDATLVVHRPDGSWACDDDTEGVLPVVTLSGAPAGRYAVWLGAFAPSPDEPTARLYAGVPPPPPVLDLAAAARAGAVRVSGGFVDAQGVVEVSVRAGGPDAASALDLSGTPDPPFGCTGYIDAAHPTVAIDYDAAGGTSEIGIAAASPTADLVLVVRTPDGRVLCNDDYGSSDPAVGLADAASGTYTVWVGTFSASVDRVAATVAVFEEAPADIDGDSEGPLTDEDVYAPFSEGSYLALDVDSVPGVRLRVTSGQPASSEVTVRPEGLSPVQGYGCAGALAAAPTASIELDGEGPFALTAHSDGDLTLTVRTPGGAWLCSDDADGLDPGIQIDAPEPGLYRAWVGSFIELGDDVTAVLSAEAGELAVSYNVGAMMDAGRLTQSVGTYTGTAIRAEGAPVTLRLGSDTSQTRTVEAGGPILVPVEGAACGGFVGERPSLAVEADGPFVLSASSDQDLTLVIRAPDGTWTCSDDADGTNPRATVASGPGTYAVWVGTYYRRTEPIPVMVRLSAPSTSPVAPPTIRR